jgi:hypothetical protein
VIVTRRDHRFITSRYKAKARLTRRLFRCWDLNSGGAAMASIAWLKAAGAFLSVPRYKVTSMRFQRALP